MEAFQEMAQKKGEAALTQAIAGVYLKKGLTVDALMLKTEDLAAARALLPSSAEQAPALTSTQIAKIPGGLQASDLKTAKQALVTMREEGDRSGEASALGMVANACIAAGEAKAAARAATEALTIYRELGTKDGEVPALQTIIRASFVRRDMEEAKRASKEIVKIAKGTGAKKTEALAMASMVGAYVANGEIPAALQAAQEALALFKELGDKMGQLSIWSLVADANYLSGKPVAAGKAAKEALALAKGDKKSEAAVSLKCGTVEDAQNALSLFKDLGDKPGQGAALISAATAYLISEQKQFDEAVEAARDAVTILKEAGSKAAEALATSVLAVAYTAKEDTQEATTTARDALNIYRDLGDIAGESYAMTVLSNAKVVGVGVSSAQLLIDNSGVAHVELNENATQESLEAVIEALLGATNIGAVVLHLEGNPGPSALQSYAVTSGAFILGLRTVGLPLICACWGKIAGPSWGFVLAADYVFAATSTTFILPVWGPPETLGDLVGHNVATTICMTHGPQEALKLLEYGVVHQCQKGKDDTRKCAAEMAKRIAARPTVAQSQTMHLLSPAIEKYALCAAKGGVRAC